MNSTTQDELKPLKYYHLSYCDSYEILRGVYPNNRRETNKPCSCGFDKALQLAVVEAQLNQLNYDYSVGSMRQDIFDEQISGLMKQKAELEEGK